MTGDETLGADSFADSVGGLPDGGGGVGAGAGREDDEDGKYDTGAEIADIDSRLNALQVGRCCCCASPCRGHVQLLLGVVVVVVGRVGNGALPRGLGWMVSHGLTLGRRGPHCAGLSPAGQKQQLEGPLMVL